MNQSKGNVKSNERTKNQQLPTKPLKSINQWTYCGVYDQRKIEKVREKKRDGGSGKRESNTGNPCEH